MASLPLDNMDKLTITTNWLKTIFRDELVPKFDITESLLDDLYNVMQNAISLERGFQAYDNFLSKCIQDYEDDFNRMMRLLSAVGLKSECMTGSISQETKTLSTLAALLALGNTEETSYILSLSELIMEKEKTTSQVNALEKSISCLQQDLAQSLLHTEKLEKLVTKQQRLDPDNIKAVSMQKREAEFLSQKVVKYKVDQKKLENTLTRRGVTQSLLHPKILSDYEDLCKVEGRLQTTEQELQMFSNLPPDKELAKVKLAVAKAELKDLEDELAKQIDMYHI